MEKIWFKDLSEFINGQNFLVFFPSNEMTLAEQLNSLMRLSIYFTILVLVIKKNSNILFVPIMMGIFTYLIYNVDTKNKANDKEIMEKAGVREGFHKGELCQRPTRHNPFMNVLVSDYSDNVHRPKACKLNKKVEKEISKNFDVNLYRDVDDIFNKIASDRQFYTTPSTTIPNDSVGYAKWLYGSGATCKDGNGQKCYTNIYRSLNV